MPIKSYGGKAFGGSARTPLVTEGLTLSVALIFVAEGLFIYIYFLLFEENHQNRISRAGEKISLMISLFCRKMTV